MKNTRNEIIEAIGAWLRMLTDDDQGSGLPIWHYAVKIFLMLAYISIQYAIHYILFTELVHVIREIDNILFDIEGSLFWGARDLPHTNVVGYIDFDNFQRIQYFRQRLRWVIFILDTLRDFIIMYHGSSEAINYTLTHLRSLDNMLSRMVEGAPYTQSDYTEVYDAGCILRAFLDTHCLRLPFIING